MNETNLEENLKKVIDGLMDIAINENTPNNFTELVMSLQNTYLTKNAESYSCCVAFKLEILIEQLSKTFIKDYPILNKKAKGFLPTIWVNFSSYSHFIADFISKFEGSSCSVDKSRWLLESYMNYLITENYPDMNIEEKCYWKPHFGSAEQWMEWIELYIRNTSRFNIEYFNLTAILMKEATKKTT